MIDEIEKRRRSFPDLAQVDEIWIVETMFYGTDFGGDYIRFELYEGGVGKPALRRAFDRSN